MSAPPAAARERLLTAWRGEILAGAVYDLIARRLDQREADILRRMSEAESGHRGRLEQRMQELGVPVPDPAAVRVPLWLRMQARVAPIDRLLAAREVAEDEEVDDLYKRSTGDPDTDRLLREIRKEERSHSLAVADLRSGSSSDGGLSSDGGSDPELGDELADVLPPGRPLEGRIPSNDGPVVAPPGARARLDRILGRERCTGRVEAGSRVRSTAPTTGLPPCSGSSPGSLERPAARPRC